jgi:hypothetical protein
MVSRIKVQLGRVEEWQEDVFPVAAPFGGEADFRVLYFIPDVRQKPAVSRSARGLFYLGKLSGFG